MTDAQPRHKVTPSRRQRRVLVAMGFVAASMLAATFALLALDDGGTGCGERAESIDPSSLHVVAGVEVSYDLNPPTTGPHRSPAPAGGTYDAPIDGPGQVGALESGLVIVQYSGLEQAAIAELELLAHPRVIVAPAGSPIDEGAKIALTAWGIRQLCDNVDLDVARAFISERVDVVGNDHP